jgi:hypothetical protein
VNQCFQGTVRHVSNDNYLRIMLLEFSELVLPLPMTVRLLVFTMFVGCWFPRLPYWGWAWE